MFFHWTSLVERNFDYWQQTSTISTVLDIAYYDGVYVAVGQNGKTWKSTDRITWGEWGPSGVTTDIVAVTHNGSKFYAVYSDATGMRIIQSTNGEGWSPAYSSGNSYVAAGIISDGAGRTLAVSVDGDLMSEDTTISQPWSPAGTIYAGADINRAHFANGTFYLGNGFIYRGPGSDRVDVTNLAATQEYDIAFNGSFYVIVGNHSAPSTAPAIFKTSGTNTNTGQWSVATAPSGDYKSIAWGSGRFIAVDTTQTTIKSTDGSTFTNLGFTGTDAILNKVRFINNEFIAVGSGIWLLYTDQ
jgi:hypothetical protein